MHDLGPHAQQHAQRVAANEAQVGLLAAAAAAQLLQAAVQDEGALEAAGGGGGRGPQLLLLGGPRKHEHEVRLGVGHAVEGLAPRRGRP